MAQSKNLDTLSVSKLVEFFLREEEKNIKQLSKQKENIAKSIKAILIKIKKGGRIIYAGAGTSGRLGILDASECKPTFGTNIFKAVIAGGKGAITSAKEMAEDNTKAALKDFRKINLNKNDVLVGISASGETPCVLSALKFARKIKTTTVGITSKPDSTLAKISDYKITPLIEREIIQGSSRLKSGTAQKIILNILSSVSMIKSGKVYGDLMIDVIPTNNKLVKRAIGIISMVCKIPFSKAEILFSKAKKNVKAAIVMHCRNCSLSEAKVLLNQNSSNLRKIID